MAASRFVLRPEWAGPRVKTATIDVNLGHSPEAFVDAAHCQISGAPAPASLVKLWSERLRSDPHVRRIDVVRELCEEHRRQAPLSYSDPWLSQTELDGAPERRVKREVGAVFMFFFGCPGGVNCELDWANTHALGMAEKHELYGFAPGEAGFYAPCEPGFWRRELSEARYAGLDFLLLNTYGPDIENDKLGPLHRALSSLGDPVKLALFDDTWTWGEPWFGDFWKQKPDFSDRERTAATLYEAKWKPFYSGLDPRHWYRFKGRPFIYFYNAGKLPSRHRSAAVLERMKARFRADFGEEPFVVVDTAYFEDPDMPRVADSEFRWFTFGLEQKRSRSTLHGHVLDHAMVKWDAVGRDRPGKIATSADLLIKGPELLERVLRESLDAELLVLATWNDIGEGTGIHRNYDYYSGGRWLEPDHFMRSIRVSQSGV